MLATEHETLRFCERSRGLAHFMITRRAAERLHSPRSRRCLVVRQPSTAMTLVTSAAWQWRHNNLACRWRCGPRRRAWGWTDQRRASVDVCDVNKWDNTDLNIFHTDHLHKHTGHLTQGHCNVRDCECWHSYNNYSSLKAKGTPTVRQRSSVY